MMFPTLNRRWNPWSDLLSLQDEMNRLFESTMGTTPRAALLGSDYLPAVDIYRTKENLIVKVDLPGMKKEDVEITMLNGRLLIRGEKRRELQPDGEGNAHRLERFYGSFERVIDLPTSVEVDRIKAIFNDGVLEITAPVREEAKPRQITVDVK